ncbi:hypothetical protein G6F70_008912 [Rhizopus microsporus]|nr:hypothetical protein G6F71_008523 [Rhizopus microsporus]KAG1194154.1 hypothetical protein G6F70_008912 [Rhizopus microsporus]KAG1206352.1 hypothetical protein G6F69_008898 [Rhizopus microsporus]KAG1226659.1 hypothetical protein G6F67_008875 [Rhizopus microsporus]KAG1258390.1 hypothetical protein G6F68_008796 [Rhizopus microsporus]
MLTDRHCKEFKEKGYTILLDALNKQQVELLHNEADELANYLMSEQVDLVKDLGCVLEPWTCGYIDTPETKEYKVNKQEYVKIRDSIYPSDHATVSGLLFDTYAIWASQLLNSKDIYLLNEQYIVKPPLSSSYSQFVWHRDSDYYHDTSIKNQMTVACWTALDDVNRVNGTVIVEDGHVVEIPAGSILFMSSHLLHKSTGNASTQFRRLNNV